MKAPGLILQQKLAILVWTLDTRDQGPMGP